MTPNYPLMTTLINQALTNNAIYCFLGTRHFKKAVTPGCLVTISLIIGMFIIYDYFNITLDVFCFFILITFYVSFDVEEFFLLTSTIFLIKNSPAL